MGFLNRKEGGVSQSMYLTHPLFGLYMWPEIMVMNPRSSVSYQRLRESFRNIKRLL